MPSQRSLRLAATVSQAPVAVERLKAQVGQLSTLALNALDQQLPWYRSLLPDQRSALGLVAQRGITHFVQWCQDPDTPAWVLADVFGSAPSELSRAISLQRALQLIRTVVGVVEDEVPELAEASEQPALREAVLLYSREIAFAAADVYARAAERRGAWDSRLEALVVDAVLRGEGADALRSRLSAVGWRSVDSFCVVVGRTAGESTANNVADIRRAAMRAGKDAVIGIQGERLLVLLGGVNETDGAFEPLADQFGGEYVVIGPVVDTVEDFHNSARQALAGLAAAPAWPDAPRVIRAEDLWPERALAGDQLAIAELIERVYEPIAESDAVLAQTLSTYVAGGRSLEGTARELYVHANTVRYRLRRVTELTGWDPLLPRDALVLHVALIVGRIHDSEATP
ncbi:PucR family transcriptional regulator [Arthrobacter sp. HMSC06H05]|uniref:PucR family transcriptional regulator n=1 Tax=Pseudoglutamicibacter albus DNF00011 TaxID=1401063 RepID=A0A095YHY9_9MICC|nr:PucR family transcriptional regulator [Pseudoglutamicibacter albus DNF00011]OFT24245.1 PucR family transcriptional regulator [Arthrobacter sp. HMSC08H08]OFT43382.1 PucR family transcriptional regulator [Arthrobacter sp. HMSC06H05]